VFRVLRWLLLTLTISAGYGALGVMLLLAGARWTMPESVHGPVGEGSWTDRSRAAFTVAGFYPAEADASFHAFSWTSQTARVELSELNRSRVHRFTVLVRSNRSPDQTPPQVRMAVDGITRLVEELSNSARQLSVEIPRHRGTGAVVTLDSSPTVVPGSEDPRVLGVIVDDIAIAPVDATFMPSTRVLILAGLAVLATVIGLRFCGISGWIGVASSIAVAMAYAWLLLQDAAFLSVYAERLARIGVASAAAGALIGLVRRQWPGVSGVPELWTAAGLLLAATALKVALFWHPLAVVGDGTFHVHRAELVHRGQYLFTSVTPKPFFEFPYPIALYVIAQPFWQAFPGELDRLRLLRAIALVAEALVGVALYGAVRRQWADRTTALLCAALWPSALAPFQALCNANLTNAFGQSMCAVALAGVAWLSAVPRLSVQALVLIGGCLVIALLSHFGAASIGIIILVAIAAMLIANGTGHTRRVGASVLALSIVAGSVSWVTYYANFKEVYARTWVSVRADGQDNSSKMTAAPSVKLERWWTGIGDDYGRPGVPVLLVSIAGLIVLVRRQVRRGDVRPGMEAASGARASLAPRGGASLVILAWILAWAALTALGLLTPIVLRANLAAAPAFIVLCAIALGALASHSRAAAVTAILLALLVAWDGWQLAVECLRLRVNS
jgi:hypothetical protein